MWFSVVCTLIDNKYASSQRSKFVVATPSSQGKDPGNEVERFLELHRVDFCTVLTYWLKESKEVQSIVKLYVRSPLRVRSFGMIRIRICDSRSQGSWQFKEIDESTPDKVHWFL